MDGHILTKTQNMLCLCLVLLGEIPGGRALSLVGLPGTGKVTEHSPAGTVVYNFSISLATGSVATGFPVIINSNPLTKAFSINPESVLTYKVVTTGNPTLDYETMPSQFDLQILVYDTAGENDLQILKIQVLPTKEPPVFQGNMADQTVIVYILETKRPANPIYQIRTADSENGSLSYSLTPTSDPFSVSSTGTISSLKDFDSESDPPYYVLNITVTNNLGLSATRTLIVNIINVNDETPYFITNERLFRIPEESTPRTLVTIIKAKDPDDRNGFTSLRYSISNPLGSPDFYINPVTGAIEVARRIDREGLPNPNISLIIRVTDSPSSGQSNETSIVIIIEDKNDNPPECTKYNFSWDILETATNETIIDLKQWCCDRDAEPPNNWFNFTELSGVESNKFTQDPPGSGRIKFIGNFDLENGAMNEYTLSTQVYDVASPYYANNIYIYFKINPVNEFYPVFSRPSYVFNVSEIDPVNSQVGIVSATDKDVPSTGISYSIVAGGSTLYYSDVFWIHPKEGIVKIVAPLDYETTKTYNLTVLASDNEGLSTTAPVIVNVLEANDEKPICSPNSYSLAVPVNTAPGTNVNGFTVTCTDRDSSPKSFFYSIGSGNVNNHFTFSPNAGSNVSRLILARPFDYEGGLDKVWGYTLNVFVTDTLLSNMDRAGVHIQTGTVTITIKVIPNPTTVATTTPGITLVTSRKNVYFASAWYVPFIICLGSLLLLGFLGYLLYLLAKYIRTHCPPKPKAEKKPLIKMPEKKKAKKEVVWEMTNINTVFDGEARDPVTGKLYEFNSKSGARRWKDTNAPPQEEAKDPVAQVTTTATASKSQGNLNEKEAESSVGKLQGSNSMAPKPPEKKKTEISGQDSTLKLQMPKEEPLGKGPSPPIPPRRSPIPSPKIYPSSISQKSILKNEV